MSATLNSIMEKAPKWSEVASRLPPTMPVEVRESVRRLGARTRHEARVSAAAAWLDGLWPSSDGPIPSVLADAIRAALAASGTPGSACGSAPPGLLRGTPSMEVWRAAIQTALADRTEQNCGMATTGVDEDGTVLVFWVGIERSLALDPRDPVAEHLLACLAADEAREILAAIERGDDPLWTGVHELHAQAVAVRRRS